MARTPKLKVSDKKRIDKLESLLEKNVDAGVAFLDKKFGKTKWLEKVNEAILNIDDGKICMTGQIFGDYGRFLTDEDLTEDEATGLGFNTIGIPDVHYTFDSHDYYIDAMNMLTTLWYCRVKALKKVRHVK